MRPHFHYGPIKWSHKMQFVFVADGGFVLSYAMPWLHFAINWQKIQNANYAITLGPNGRTDVALGRRMPPPPLWASQWDAGSFLNQNIANIFFECLDTWKIMSKSINVLKIGIIFWHISLFKKVHSAILPILHHILSTKLFWTTTACCPRYHIRALKMEK